MCVRRWRRHYDIEGSAWWKMMRTRRWTIYDKIDDTSNFVWTLIIALLTLRGRTSSSLHSTHSVLDFDGSLRTISWNRSSTSTRSHREA